MKGKIGIVVGLAAGYVLGSRAGRDRYEQIKDRAQKLWETDSVQKQVDKVKEIGSSAAQALPSALWDGAVKATKAASKKASSGEKLDGAGRPGTAPTTGAAASRGTTPTGAGDLDDADGTVAGTPTDS